MFSIVIVDDQPTSVKIMSRLVDKLPLETQVNGFTDPAVALEWSKQNACDLLILDLRMPVMSGVEFVRWFRKLPGCDDVPVVIVSVAEDLQSRYSALAAGATDFLTKPLDHVEFQARCRNLLSLREHQRQSKDRARWLEKRVAAAVEEVALRERDTLLHLAKASAYRDPYTGRHVQRMAKYSRIIAERLGLAEDFCHTLEFAAPLHDIGKIGVPDHILRKAGPLTETERSVMNTHVTIGNNILVNSPSKYLQMGATIALNHHERFDGDGYPKGLSGEQIPLEARIAALADVYDALTSARPYKPAWPLQKTLEHIKAGVGRHFDPRCVKAFFGALDAVLHVQAICQDDNGAEFGETEAGRA